MGGQGSLIHMDGKRDTVAQRGEKVDAGFKRKLTKQTGVSKCGT